MNIKEKAFRTIIDQRATLISKGFVCSEIEEKLYNFETSALKNKQKNKLQVYFGKKGIKTVIQGSNLSVEYNEIQSIVTGNDCLPFTDQKDQQYEEYIGTDETGKGDFFGPLVIAGIYVNKEIQSYFTNLGVRDSKELSDSEINRIAFKIKSKFPNHYSIISIHPEKYNRLYEEFRNVNKMLNWGHSKIIENLFKDYKSKYIIVDQFSKTPLNISLKPEFSKIHFIMTPKAERYVGVAAASILARNQMNKWFEEKKNEGYNVLKGASKEVEYAAKNILVKHGKNKIANLVKLHFKTTKKISEI